MELIDKYSVFLNAIVYIALTLMLIYALYTTAPYDTYKRKWKGKVITLMIVISAITALLYLRWHVLKFDYNHTENMYWNIKDLFTAVAFFLTAFVNFKR